MFFFGDFKKGANRNGQKILKYPKIEAIIREIILII